MIAVSLLLIAGAVVLLVIGVWQASSLLLGMSIGLSLLSAVGLVVAARRDAVAPVPPVSAQEVFGAGRRRPVARVSSPPPAPPSPPPAPPSPPTPAPPSPPPSAPPGAPPASAPPSAPPPAAAPEPPSETAVATPATAVEPETTGPAEPPVAPAAAGGVPSAREPEAGPIDAPPAGERPEDPVDEPDVQPVSPGDAARVAQLTAEVLVVDGRPRYHQPGCVSLLGRQSERLPVNEAVELGFTPCGLCEPDSALLADARRV